MSDKLEQIILSTISQDSTAQKTGEQTLKQLSTEDSNSYILNLLALLKHSQNKDIRTFIASHIRKVTSKYSEQSFTCIWEQLQAGTQTTVKTLLFELLKSEESSTIRKLISDCIGELGSSLIEDPKNNQWPELLPQTWQLFSSDNVSLQESGFKILTNLLTFASDNFKNSQNDLKTLFQSGVQNTNVQIRVACIESIGAYICELETKDQKNFSFLLPAIYTALYEVTQASQDEGFKILEVLNDLAEAEPKFLSETFEQLFSLIWKLNIDEKSKYEKDIKELGTETLTAIVTKLPKIIRSNQQYLAKLLELVFSHMIDVDQEVTPEWCQPQEGFNEDLEEDADFESIRFGINTIDRIIDAVGDKETLPALWDIVGKLLAVTNDWRYNYAAIMSLSQIGQYVEEEAVLKSIVEKILAFQSHQNPMVRYSVLHSLSQISEDSKPLLQDIFENQITEVLFRTLSDPVPRVVSQACSALGYYFEGLKDSLLDNDSLQRLLTVLFERIDNGISIVKEKAVFALGSLIELAKDKFNPYFDTCMPLLFKIFDVYTKNEYRQLRGNAIECITLVSQSISKEKFAPYLEKIILTIVGLQETQMETSKDNVDPLKSYVLTGWQRLSLNYSQQLINYLPKIIPGIYKLIEQIVVKSSKEGNDEIYNSDEAELALEMLDVFISEFGTSFSQYVEQTTKLLVPLCGYKHSETIRDLASKCLPGLVSCAKNEPTIQQNMVRYFINLLWEVVDKEYFCEVLIAQISSMKSCIESTGEFMTQEELDSLSDKIVKLLLDSDKRKAETEQWKNQNDVEDNEKEILEEDLHLEEDLQVQIAELIGTLFKTHKQKTLRFAELLYTQVLPQVLDPKASDKMHKFGIFLIDDMVEFLGYELLGADKWAQFAKAQTLFAVDKNAQVRQAAVYGLGIFAINTPVSVFSQYQQPILKALSDAASIPQGAQKDKNYAHCRDNVISSIGKIIRHQYENVNVGELIPFWMQNLPLKKDKPEAYFNHKLLAELVLNKFDIFASNNDQLSQIVKIFGQVIQTKLANEETNLFVQNALKVLVQNEFVKSNWNSIVSTLTEAQLNKLKKSLSA